MPSLRSIVLCLSSLLASSGCATLEIPWVNQTPQASRRNPVMQVVCMWEPSEGRDPNGIPCRGFAGQILFLGNRGGTPVAVDGDVSIFVFDDLGTIEEQAKPLHEFRFDAASWNRHMKVGSLGPAYHCFIPYSRPGNLEANCTLRLKLIPSDEQPSLMSDASNVAMRGRSRNPGFDGQGDSGNMVYYTSPPVPGRESKLTTIALDQPAGTRQQSGGVVLSGHEVASDPADTPEARAQRVLDEFRHNYAHQATTAAQHANHTSTRLRLKPDAILTAEAPVDVSADDEARIEELIRKHHHLQNSSDIQPASFTTESDADGWDVE